MKLAGAAAAIGLGLSTAANAAAPRVAPAEEPAGVTVAEAQTLPVGELAHRILGDIGALVADVDRPSWGPPPQRFPGVPLLPSWPPPIPPPMNELVFYSRPAVAGGGFGLCEETVFRVVMGSGPVAAPTGLWIERWYGVVGSPDRPTDDWSDRYVAELAATCRDQPVSRTYFPAPNPYAASAAAGITLALASAARSNAPPAFGFSCSDDRYPCRYSYRNLHDLDVSRITEVREIPCPKAPYREGEVRECYHILYSTGLEGGRRVLMLRAQDIDVEADVADRTIRILSVAYDESVATP
jgi:hypothetical protein